MINLKPQIRKKLEEISNVEVFYFYPDEWVKDNIISYYELDNSEASDADDEEYSSNIAIQIDIWCNTPDDCSVLAIEVNKKMKELEFKRTLVLDLNEKDAIKKHRKTMRFEKEEIL